MDLSEYFHAFRAEVGGAMVVDQLGLLVVRGIGFEVQASIPRFPGLCPFAEEDTEEGFALRPAAEAGADGDASDIADFFPLGNKRGEDRAILLFLEITALDCVVVDFGFDIIEEGGHGLFSENAFQGFGGWVCLALRRAESSRNEGGFIVETLPQDFEARGIFPDVESEVFD